jgi:hypothetical protein
VNEEEESNARFKNNNARTIGPQNAGPMANPRMKREMVRVNSMRLMLKLGVSSREVEEGAEEVIVTIKTDMVTIEVMNHLRDCDQFMGLLGSSLWNSTTKGSSSVPLPS